MIVAIDFDDTIFPYDNPKDTCNKIISLVKRASKLGFIIILFAAREGERLEWAISYMKALGIAPDYVNSSPVIGGGKPYYNILLDDKAGLGQAYECLLEAINIIEKQ